MLDYLNYLVDSLFILILQYNIVITIISLCKNLTAYRNFSICFLVQHVPFSKLSGGGVTALKMMHILLKNFCWNEGNSYVFSQWNDK